MALTTEREVYELRTAGYRHHSREHELKLIHSILRGELGFLDHVTPDDFNTNVLAPDPLRSLKNNVICAIAILSRAVIDAGAEPEKGFAIEFSYINRVENQSTAKAVTELTVDMVRHFSRLYREERLKNYSVPVMRAIRYIHSNLLEPFNVRDIAAALNLHPNYLTALFHKEAGLTLTAYIKRLKLEEAKRLLLESWNSITEVAEILGYSSVSYFSKDFHRANGCSPKQFVAANKWPPEQQ
jgi:YesN/AraC family two-component response regulator